MTDEIDGVADQAWFWDLSWQIGEQEAEEDIREGRTETHLDTDEFLASLTDEKSST